MLRRRDLLRHLPAAHGTGGAEDLQRRVAGSLSHRLSVGGSVRRGGILRRPVLGEGRPALEQAPDGEEAPEDALHDGDGEER